MQVSDYLKAAFPAANITARNGALPAVTSSYHLMCGDLAMDNDVSGPTRCLAPVMVVNIKPPPG